MQGAWTRTYPTIGSLSLKSKILLFLSILRTMLFFSIAILDLAIYFMYLRIKARFWTLKFKTSCRKYMPEECVERVYKVYRDELGKLCRSLSIIDLLRHVVSR